MHFHGYELSLVISNEEIQKRVAEIAKNLSEKFKDEVPILIGILNGSFIFMSDLIRALKIDCEMDFIKLSSYTGDQSIGTIRLLKDISADRCKRIVSI